MKKQRTANIVLASFGQPVNLKFYNFEPAD